MNFHKNKRMLNENISKQSHVASTAYQRILLSHVNFTFSYTLAYMRMYCDPEKTDLKILTHIFSTRDYKNMV
jgi:hypothetical protein